MKNHGMKERLRVDELEENKIELKEAAEATFPLIILASILSIALLAVFLLRLYIRWGAECPSKNRMDGKTIIITGANTGLGKFTAMELAKRGGRLILGCRDRVKGEAVARIIRKKTGNQNVFASRLDLANLSSIKEFVQEFNEKEQKLHVLINNAAYLGPKAATDDGYERAFGVNHLGHFYLTLLLMDKLKKCAPSRVVHVCSDAYTIGKLDFSDLAMLKGYEPYRAYARSKLAQVIFNMECHRHFITGCVLSFAVHPGATCTDLLRNYPGMYGNLLRGIARVLFKSPDEGCQTIVYAAVADGLRDFSGKMFANCKAIKLNDNARDKNTGMKLWNTSLHLTGLERDFVPYSEGGEDQSAQDNGEHVFNAEVAAEGGGLSPEVEATVAEKRPSPAPASSASAAGAAATAQKS